MKRKTCILYFALSPMLEARRKHWTKSKKVNLKIAQRLHEDTLSKIRSTRLSYLEINEDEQHGTRFGENISEAIQDVFDRGFEHIIVLGNDCPDISKHDILSAHRNIRFGVNTLGLTRDGGSFLFTVCKDEWKKSSFSRLPWCTGQLGDALHEYLDHQGNIQTLKTKADVDFFKDILYLVGHSRSMISLFLKEVIGNHILPFFLFRHSQSAKSNTPHRGPPAFA